MHSKIQEENKMRTFLITLISLVLLLNVSPVNAAENITIDGSTTVGPIVNKDIKSAREVLAADNEMDDLVRELYAKVIDLIKKDPQGVELLIQYIHIARHLERVADHTTNIAEDMICLISGEIARHVHKI